MKCFKRFLISLIKWTPTNSSILIVPKWMLWFCGQWTSYSRAQRKTFSVWQALRESLFLNDYYLSENLPLRSFPLAHLCWYFYSILPSAFNFHFVDFPMGLSGQREKTEVQWSHTKVKALETTTNRVGQISLVYWNLARLMVQAMSRGKTPTFQGPQDRSSLKLQSWEWTEFLPCPVSCRKGRDGSYRTSALKTVLSRGKLPVPHGP